MKSKISVLGTEYRIEIHKVSEDEYLENKQLSGYCCEESKLIVVADMSEKKYFDGMDENEQEIYRNKVLRHEIIHAFLNESGLSDSASIPSSAWAKHEEMIDWFAIQSPKIFAVFMENGLIEVDMSIKISADIGSNITKSVIDAINKNTLKMGVSPIVM